MLSSGVSGGRLFICTLMVPGKSIAQVANAHIAGRRVGVANLGPVSIHAEDGDRRSLREGRNPGRVASRALTDIQIGRRAGRSAQ